jgi:hypothetical protein
MRWTVPREGQRRVRVDLRQLSPTGQPCDNAGIQPCSGGRGGVVMALLEVCDQSGTGWVPGEQLAGERA